MRNTVDITITDTNPNYESEISNREVTALPVTGKASSVIIVSVGLLLIVGFHQEPPYHIRQPYSS